MAQYNKIGTYQSQMRAETVLTLDIENFIRNHESVSGNLISEYGTLNFSANYIRNGLNLSLSMAENRLSLQQVFQDLKNPFNAQEITVNFNGNEHHAAINNSDIERLIKNKELGPYEGILRIIKQSSDVKEFSESLKNLQNVLTTTNVTTLVATIAEDSDEPITVFKTLWECILAGLGYIAAIIGLAACATIFLCFVAILGVVAASHSLASCLVYGGFVK
ncbi:MAG: hypothetical protein Q8K98_12680 [Bacteroidota bacterium]|nr:hypothetical protein [Bacteroidota bacterium]